MGASTETTYTISGMHCGACAQTLEKGLSEVEGIERAEVNFAMGSAKVVYDPSALDDESISKAVVKIGYSASKRREDDILNFRVETDRAFRKLAISALFALPLYFVNMNAGAHTLPDIGYPLGGGSLTGYLAVAILATLILVLAGRGIFIDAYRQTRRWQANMNSLIALGSGAAYLFSLYNLTAYLAGTQPLTQHLYFETAGVIVTLILLGRYLEARASGKTKQAIVALLDLRPQKATALINGVQVEIESAAAQPGMTLLVRPGERIPADGIVSKESPTIDEAMLTGESIPVEKNPGDGVIGGSINGSLPFEMEVKASGEESYLASVIRLVSEAQSSKAPIQRLADRIAGVFTPIVLVVAAITFAAWFVFGSEADSLMRYSTAITVLIIACPCALGLATPTAVLTGSSAAARRGILIKGAETLERLVHADAFVFDKTGTLTIGKPEVVALGTVAEITEDELITIAAALEDGSEHPLGKGIVELAESRGVRFERADEIKALTGFGVRGMVDGKPAMVGSKTACEKAEISLAELEVSAAEETERGRTVIYVVRAGHALGYFALTDKIRPEAREVISKLHADGAKVFMFTGDDRRTARTTAKALGIDHVEAEVKPEQKSELTRALGKAGYHVVMVGDGINDAPALAQAEVGVAIGSGTDVAKQTADVILVKSDLRYLQAARDVARQTFRVIKQNLFWAFIYNIIAIPVAAGVFYPVWGWSLTPKIGALTMALSSVLVVSNSIRLSWGGRRARNVSGDDEAIEVASF